MNYYPSGGGRVIEENLQSVKSMYLGRVVPGDRYSNQSVQRVWDNSLAKITGSRDYISRGREPAAPPWRHEKTHKLWNPSVAVAKSNKIK
jgi:hypothetical protein